MAWLPFGLVKKFWTFFKGWKSVTLEVWAAPGAPETLAKGGGLRSPGPPRPQKWPISNP
jgi:hypothetical protein